MNDLDMIAKVYTRLAERHAEARRWFGRPLTLAEKVLSAHLVARSGAVPQRRKSTTEFKPDRVAMQDATAQMAVLQFMSSGMRQTAVPTTVHCDHLIRARKGAQADMLVALDENAEVYSFLQTAARKYGMGFWHPGSGIIHQVVLEHYAFPGGMMIGTDSHTPNAGGLGMVAVGVGGADAVDVMVDEPFGLLWPGVIGVRLSGALRGWAAPKDVILQLMGILTVKGGTNSIVEFFGPGAASLSCTGKATICNMGAEHGATCSLFPYDERMAAYLQATQRADLADLADRHRTELTADAEVLSAPEKFYDRVVDIDLTALEPMIAGPHTPDLVRPIGQMAEDIRTHNYPDDLTYGLIGSCTNSSYEDMGRSADLARQAGRLGLRAARPLLVTPGSDQIHNTMARDGQTAALEAIGATVLANACGPCIGQWHRDDPQAGQRNSIINSYNRNFPRRNDGSAETMSFIASPEIVTALALAGRLSFNPLTDKLVNSQGREVALSPPRADELPAGGFVPGMAGFEPPGTGNADVEVRIDPKSQRLQALAPFPAWDGRDFEDLIILLQAAGKCTTDHISPAGPWLRYRGHLDNISNNAFLGANNRLTSEPGTARNIFSGQVGALPEVARDYRERGSAWCVIGDENYGEGSSREHAALTPRFLGCRVVLARSFARIHETNLKKQGVLPLTFVDPADYDKFKPEDRVSVRALGTLAPGSEVQILVRHSDGGTVTMRARHSLTDKQIAWFKAGSALNALGRTARK